MSFVDSMWLAELPPLAARLLLMHLPAAERQCLRLACHDARHLLNQHVQGILVQPDTDAPERAGPCSFPGANSLEVAGWRRARSDCTPYKQQHLQQQKHHHHPYHQRQQKKKQQQQHPTPEERQHRLVAACARWGAWGAVWQLRVRCSLEPPVLQALMGSCGNLRQLKLAHLGRSDAEDAHMLSALAALPLLTELRVDSRRADALGDAAAVALAGALRGCRLLSLDVPLACGADGLRALCGGASACGSCKGRRCRACWPLRRLCTSHRTSVTLYQNTDCVYLIAHGQQGVSQQASAQQGQPETATAAAATAATAVAAAAAAAGASLCLSRPCASCCATPLRCGRAPCAASPA